MCVAASKAGAEQKKGSLSGSSDGDSEEDDDEDDDPRAQQRRQGQKMFKPNPNSATRIAGEHISITLAPGMRQVSLFCAMLSLQ